MINLEGKSILVTGGTGSFGRAFIRRLLENSKVEKIRVFSRDELKQFEMASEFESSRLEFYLGDVRDLSRLRTASRNVDVIVHAAAMKQIVASEFNPTEAIATNVGGTENVVAAAVDNGVSHVLALSTDKAANPANLYGATKLCAEKIVLAANLLESDAGTKFSAVRYGNVIGSRGSVIPFFLKQKDSGRVTITDNRMTRFWITLDQGVDFVLSAIKSMQGGEIFVPKLPSMKVSDVAEILCPGVKQIEIGIRPGEKLHAVMLTENDSAIARELPDRYIIVQGESTSDKFWSQYPPVPARFIYSSDSNTRWFSKSEFSELLKSQGFL